MKKRYYIFGERPIIEEKEEKYSTFYAFQWATGEFKEDMSYMGKLFHDEYSEGKEITKEEFDSYVKEIKDRKGIK